MVPIFPELRQLLEDVKEIAEDRTVHVISKYRQQNANLRTQFERMIKRAGFDSWPRLFQNLRASRETELANEFPLHVVTAWLGNTERVASKHYLQVTDDHFAQAQRVKTDAIGPQNVSKPTPQDTATRRNGSQEVTEPPGVTSQVMIFPTVADAAQVPPRGVELSQESPRNTLGDTQSGTLCGTPDAQSGLSDPDLRAIIEAWPGLPDTVKAGILAMVHETGDQAPEHDQRDSAPPVERVLPGGACA